MFCANAPLLILIIIRDLFLEVFTFAAVEFRCFSCSLGLKFHLFSQESLLFLSLNNTLDVFVYLILLDVFVHLNVLFTKLDDFFVIVCIYAISMNTSIHLLFHFINFGFPLLDIILQTIAWLSWIIIPLQEWVVNIDWFKLNYFLEGHTFRSLFWFNNHTSFF